MGIRVRNERGKMQQLLIVSVAFALFIVCPRMAAVSYTHLTLPTTERV